MRKKQLSKHYNKSSAAIAYGRDRRTGEIVRLPGSVEEGNWYDEEMHKGHITCGGCDASIHLNQGCVTVEGSRNEGRSAHFKTNPGVEHAKNCMIGTKSESNEAKTGKNGFRLNFNTSTSDYYRRKRGTIVPKGLQSVSLKNIFDLAAFMRREDVSHINKSFAVFREHEAAWPHFLFSDKDQFGQQNLIKTVMKMVKAKRTVQLGAMELHVDKKKIKSPLRIPEKTNIRGQAVIIGTDNDGIKHIIIPTFSVDKRMVLNDDLVESFDKSGTYIAQGLAKLSVCNRGKVRFYFFDMQLVSHDQVMKGSLGELYKANQQNQAKKAQISAHPA